MSAKQFRALPARPCVDKRLTIEGPVLPDGTRLRIFLDYDRGSKECRETDKIARKMVAILNAGWDRGDSP